MTIAFAYAVRNRRARTAALHLSRATRLEIRCVAPHASKFRGQGPSAELPVRWHTTTVADLFASISEIPRAVEILRKTVLRHGWTCVVGARLTRHMRFSVCMGEVAGGVQSMANTLEER
jgi:hypothetical protein